MKKSFSVALATLLLTVFTACDNKDNPKVNTYTMDGQWVSALLGTTYVDINHQIPNTMLIGEWDSTLNCPVTDTESTITSMEYNADRTQCLITLSDGSQCPFVEISDNSCIYESGILSTGYVRPSSPFIFKTSQDMDTVNPVTWNMLFYVNDSLLAFYDYELVDSTSAGNTIYNTTIEAFESTGRDAEAWECIQNRHYPFKESQLKVIVANPAIKAGDHYFYLRLTRTSTPITGLQSATLMYGYKASTSATGILGEPIVPQYLYFRNGQTALETMLDKVPTMCRKNYSIRFSFRKLK